MDLYHLLDDGRIVELGFGQSTNSENAIWARNLSEGEKETYQKLKKLGHSDMDIYNHFLKQKNKKMACTGT